MRRAWTLRCSQPRTCSLRRLIPQPVFEVTGDKASDMKLIILDPLLAYTLSWHPEAFDR